MVTAMLRWEEFKEISHVLIFGLTKPCEAK